MKKEALEYMANHVVCRLENASEDAVREIIRNLDEVWNQMYEESEHLERLDVVVCLEPEQRKRAADLESMLEILCSMQNLCYEVLPKEGAEDEA